MYVNNQYEVEVTSVAQKRWIKKLEKRHKSHWPTTLTALKESVKRVEELLKTDKAEIIHAVDGHRLIKIYFTVAKSGKSAKDSGHRCIVYLESKNNKAYILLVYSKSEISRPGETDKVRGQIKNYHPSVASLFSL